MSDIRDLDYSDYLVTRDIPYIETEDELHHLRTHLRAGENIIQFGPKGIGKTMSFMKIAHEQEVPLIIHSSSKDTKKNELMTQSTMSVDNNGNRVVQQIPGAIPKGIYAANEYSRAILLFEEISSLSPNLQKLVNRVADSSGAIELEKAGEILRLNSSAELMVGGTMNPSSLTGGAFELNDDLKSRFTELERSFPKDKKFKKILRANGVESKIGEYGGVRDDIVSLVNQLRNLQSQGEVSYDYSPRDSVRLGSMWKEYYSIRIEQDDAGMNETRQSLRDTIKSCVMGKYSDENEKQVVREEIADVFGVDV